MSKKNEMTVINPGEAKSAALSDLKIHDSVANRLEINLTASIEARWDAARVHTEQGNLHYAAFGLLIKSVKDDLPHGEFLPELERRGFEERTARRAMRYAEYVFSQPVAKQARLLELPITKVNTLVGADPDVVEVLMEDGHTIEETTVRGLLDQLKRAQRDRDAFKKQAADQAEINAGLAKRKFKSDLRADTQLVRDECLHQQALCEYGAQALLKAWNNVLDEDAKAPEHKLRRDQVVIAAHAAAAAVCKVLYEILESAAGDVPKQVTSEHVLTEQEAEYWATEWDTLRRGQMMKDAARFDRTQAELPRDVGRPKGSKTGGKS